MSKRSLQASVEGIRKARQAFKRKGWTQEYLAAEVGLETRQPIWKFFSGKPVDRQVFHEICFVLELEPEEIRLQPENDYSTSSPHLEASEHNEFPRINLGNNGQGKNYGVLGDVTPEILDKQVQKVRSLLADKIQHQCGWLRLLDVARPLNLDELYVDVTIGSEVSSHRWLNLSALQLQDSQGWERLRVQTANLSQQNRESCVNGIDIVGNYPRLMVLGKPGSGKTTFLQAIAIKCNHGGLKGDCVPIFISLKRFAEAITPFSILEYICREMSDTGLSPDDWHYLFSQGRALILLDGLDEVAKNTSNWVVREICNFSDRYYKTQIIVSCRVAANLYQFQDFTAVEIADLTPNKISRFAQKWFYAVGKLTAMEAAEKATLFMQKLELPENYAIRELATTPILLNLMCLVFHGLGDFPSLRAQLYKQGLDLLLVRWDETRGIQRVDSGDSTRREETYQNLSLQDKIKILSRIAHATFFHGDYFFNEAQVKHVIGEVIGEIQGTPIDANALEFDSQAIIKAIESQHGLLIEQGRGIYSFSHLTFQEYFTAWEIALNCDPQALEQVISHMWEVRWREVFLLMVGILPVVDRLFELMRSQIDRLRNSSLQLKEYLQWIDKKTQALATKYNPDVYNPAAIRAFYFILNLPSFHSLSGNQSLALALEPKFAVELGAEIGLDMTLRHAVDLSQTITPEIFPQRMTALCMALDTEEISHIHPDLGQAIQELLTKLPDSQSERYALKTWWQTHGITWTDQLRSLLLEYRQIGYNWDIKQQESEDIQQYWQGCKLINDCLSCAANINEQQQQAIWTSLFC